MKEIHTEIVVDASAERVRSMLTNFENYPNWNPFIKSIRGEAALHKKLVVSILPPKGSGMTFKPTVVKFERNKEFRWKGKLIMKGIFDSFRTTTSFCDLVNLFQDDTAPTLRSK